MIDAKHVGTVAWLLTAWRENVIEQIPNMLQFGALGILFIVLMLIYKLSEKWLDYRITQKREEPPHSPTATGEMSYNHQMASTIHDVNRTLSEVAVTNKMIIAQTTKQSEVMEKQTVLLDRLVRLLDNGKYRFETSGD